MVKKKSITICSSSVQGRCMLVLHDNPLVRFVLVLQMQHLRGIPHVREEASRLRTARSARNDKAQAWRSRFSGYQKDVS
jgi:hypothetical protein